MTGAFADPNASAVAMPVTVSSVSLTGTAAANYTVVTMPIVNDAKVTPKTITLTDVAEQTDLVRGFLTATFEKLS